MFNTVVARAEPMVSVKIWMFNTVVARAEPMVSVKIWMFNTFKKGPISKCFD